MTTSVEERSMSTLRLLTGVMALALMAAPLAAQVGPEARIEAALERARSAGLPVEVLESKVAEGLAKNVAMARIAMAIERREQAMERAYAALSQASEGGQPSVQDVAVGTDAIEAGVSEVVLAEVSLTAGAERRAVAIAALTYLVAEGHVPEEALARVEAALARGGDALANLPGMAGGNRPEGAGPPSGVQGGGPPPGVGKTGGPPGKPPGTPGNPPGGGV
jgi:hypothetical protein